MITEIYNKLIQINFENNLDDLKKLIKNEVYYIMRYYDSNYSSNLENLKGNIGIIKEEMIEGINCMAES